MLQRILLVSFFTLSAIFSCGTLAHAQVSDQVSASVIPANPGPGDSVTVTLSSYSFDLKTAQIDWQKDGKAVSSGFGKTSYVFTAKSLGLSTTIVATVAPRGSIPIQKTITITPMTVDILWEATDAIVPPMYRGRALATSESAVRFVAIPQVRKTNGTLIAPADFSYDWSENYNADAAHSGYGKNSYDTVMDYLNPQKTVAVDVSTRDGATGTGGTFTLLPVDPKIVWYASSPLYGPLFGTALTDSYAVEGSDTSLIAMPFFFSPGDTASRMLKYTWTINDAVVDVPGSIPNSLFLHRDSSAKGTATVAVTIESLNKLFQNLTSDLTLTLQ